MRCGLAAGHDAVHARAETEQRDVRDLYTTLLLVAHGHFADGTQVAAAAQIGDGAICAFVPTSKGGSTCEELASSDYGDYSGFVRFLNQVEPVEWPDHIWVKRLPPETEAIMLLTDGIADDFVPLMERLPRLMEVVREDVMTLTRSDHALDMLRQAVSYQRKGSFDDRTILLIHRPIPTSPEPGV
jgi:protein phosphatase 2C-like protein